MRAGIGAADTPARVYYVEDDENIRELVLYTLRQAGVTAEGFPDGEGFVTLCAREKPALILLDVMLPGQDGFAILKALKENPATCMIQVIMLTARGAEYDRVRGLDTGADDYIVKPFGMMEFLSRVKAALRRSAPTAGAEALVWGRLRMDEASHELCVDGAPVRLTLKEYELLHCLLAHPGQVFSREQLLAAVWGYDYLGGTRTVDVHVQTLRQKLGDAGGAVETVRGVGYRAGREQA